jgi:GTP-binding protein EngB required for normal cell division
MLARLRPRLLRQLSFLLQPAARCLSAALACQGCGCLLQSSCPATLGFVPHAVPASASSTRVCERCFRIRNYGARQRSSRQRQADANPGSALDGAAAVNAFLRQGSAPLRVLLIVDPLDFSRGMWQQALGAAPALRHVPVDVCVTKMDLLPPACDPDSIMASIVETVGSDGNKSVFAVSSTTQNGIKKVSQHVHRVLSGGVSVLLVGFANAGKSSLANVIAGKLRRMLLPVDLQEAPAAVEATDAQPVAPEEVEFTVSKLPGTTLDVIQAPHLAYQGTGGAVAAHLYDSPGLISGFTYATLGARFCKHALLADSICISRKKKLQSLCVKSGQSMVIGRLFAVKV